MRKASIPWELYEAFLAVMRAESFSGAARDLGVTHPTVRKRIEALEDSLDATLFSRAPNGLVPTAAARRALPHAESMASMAASLGRAVSGGAEEVRGTVRVTASHVMAVEVLPPMFAALRREHPELTIELVASNANEDLLRRDADVAVRMSTPTTSGLVARKIGEVEMGFFAAPAYFETRAAPESLQELREHDLVGYDTDDQLIRGLEAIGFSSRRADYPFRTDDDLVYLAAVRSGAGIGICQAPLGRRFELARTLADVVDLSLEVWLVAHEDLRDVARIRAVLDFLAERLAGYLRG